MTEKAQNASYTSASNTLLRQEIHRIYHNSPSFSFAGTSMTLGLSMIRAVLKANEMKDLVV